MAFVEQALWPWHLNCMIVSANLLIRPANPDAQSLMASNSESGLMSLISLSYKAIWSGCGLLLTTLGAALSQRLGTV